MPPVKREAAGGLVSCRLRCQRFPRTETACSCAWLRLPLIGARCAIGREIGQGAINEAGREGRDDLWLRLRSIMRIGEHRATSPILYRLIIQKSESDGTRMGLS
jgi:hypothetical protein